jgi:heme/copper-type cytochrome/quinol oxidase subunit 2
MLSKFLIKNQVVVLITTISLALVLIVVVAFDVIKQRQDLKEIENLEHLNIKSITQEIEAINENTNNQVVENTNQNTETARPVTKITVPDANTILREEEKAIIAIPEIVVSASAHNDSQRRLFEIDLNNNIFTPKNIIVRKNDLVRIKFTAIDKDYDIVVPDYRLSLDIKENTERNLSFQAVKSGVFPYYCLTCGGLESSAQGSIIISEE